MQIARNLVVFLTIWSPIWAFIVWNIPLKGWKYYVASEFLLFSLTCLLAFNPVRVKNITYWLHYYTFFLMVYLLLIGYIYKYENFNRTLSISIFTVFIAGELWEIPIFMFDALGKMGLLENHWSGTLFDAPWYASHIRRLYTFASALLFASLTNLNGRKMVVFTLIGLALSFSILLPFAVSVNMVFSRMITTMARIVSLSLFGYFVYFEVSHPET